MILRETLALYPFSAARDRTLNRTWTRNRVQLWGEGLALYNKGERADLPRSMMRLQAEQGEIHRRKDSMIEEAVDGITGEGPFTIKEICDCTFTDAKNVRRLADALRLAGWTKNHTRLEGKRVYLWRKE